MLYIEKKSIASDWIRHVTCMAHGLDHEFQNDALYILHITLKYAFGIFGHCDAWTLMWFWVLNYLSSYNLFDSFII